MKKTLIIISSAFLLSSCAGFKAMVTEIYKDCPVKEVKAKPATGGFIVHIECDSTAIHIQKAVLESIKKQKKADEAPLLD